MAVTDMAARSPFWCLVFLWVLMGSSGGPGLCFFARDKEIVDGATARGMVIDASNEEAAAQEAESAE